MTILAPKRPDETVLYVFDWAHQLAPAADSIASFVLAITAGTITAPIADQSNAATTVQAIIAGGADGETATLVLTVTTAAGQVLIRDMSLLVVGTADYPYPSTSTKQQVQLMAFEEITLAGYEFDATAAEIASALRRLDTVMAMWAGPGMNLDIGYNFPAAIGGSSPSDLSGVPDFALDAVVITLAEAIMPAIGKSMSPETKMRKQTAMTAIRAAFTPIPERRLPRSTPRGAGNKPWSTWAPYNGRGNGGG